MSAKSAGTVSQIRSAIEKDDADELNSLLVGRNPYKLRFTTIDGRSHGIQTIAANAGAWKSLIALIDDSPRFNNWVRALDKQQFQNYDQDADAATLTIKVAMKNGIHGANDYCKRLLYWGYKNASPQKREELVAQHERDEHFEHARYQVQAEEEHALFATSVSQGKTSQRKRRGLDD